MSRKQKRTLGLVVSLVLILGLGGIYFWQQRTEDTPYETPAQFAATTVPLIRRPVTDVASVTFITTDTSYTMTHGAGFEWYYADFPDFPLDMMATFGKVAPAFNLTATNTVHEYSHDLDLAAFGLNPPQLTMEIAYTDDTTKNIYIGSQTADMTGYFVMLSDDPAVYTVGVSDVFFTFLTMDDLLDRTIAPINTDIDYLFISQRGAPTIELALPADVQDFFNAGFTADFPPSAFMHMVQPMYEFELAHWSLERRVIAEMEGFHIRDTVSLMPTNLADYGLAEPELELIYRNRFLETHLLFGDIFVHEGTEFVYVKFADRPHVFKAPYQPISIIFDLDIFLLIDRFIALTGLMEMESITIASADPTRNLFIELNHYGDHQTDPHVNGIQVPDRDFRTALQFIIGISGEGQLEPFMPTGEPNLTITYHKIDDRHDTELRLFAIDSNFYAVSLNGAEAWLATGRRNIDAFFNAIENMLP